MPTITLTEIRSDAVAPLSITVRAPEFGNVDNQRSAQTIGRTLGHRIYVLDRGNKTRSWDWDFSFLDVKERGDIEAFFGPTRVDRANNKFSIIVDPTWPVVVYAGMVFNGDVLLATDSGLYTNQRLGGCGDLVTGTVYPARLISPDLVWSELQDGHFALSMSVEVENAG